MVIARVRARLKLLEAERAELEGKLGKLQRQPAIIERLVIRLSSPPWHLRIDCPFPIMAGACYSRDQSGMGFD